MSKPTKNSPKLWLKEFPWPSPKKHKYSRGAVVVCGGDENMTGAARLSAISALRTSAGMVTVTCPKSALSIYAKTLDAMIMAKAINRPSDFAEFIKGKKCDAVVIGPGHGLGKRTGDMVVMALKSGKNMVIDADAITSFEKNPEELFEYIKKPMIDFPPPLRGRIKVGGILPTPPPSPSLRGRGDFKVVMTPHEAEFQRIFGKIKTREEAAKKAAKKSGAVILLKGADTIIAAPDGRLIVNKNAPATLATAGSGDVLSGIIGALLASGMDGFLAAAAGAWIHSECAKIFGIGLTAGDLPDLIPKVLKKLKN